VQVCQLPWGTTAENLPPHLLRGVDLILGSDLFLPFALDLLQPLCITIAALLQVSPSTAEAIIAYEERWDCSMFWTFCDQNELDVKEISIACVRIAS
jgi:hypothetical protein